VIAEYHVCLGVHHVHGVPHVHGDLLLHLLLVVAEETLALT